MAPQLCAVLGMVGNFKHVLITIWIKLREKDEKSGGGQRKLNTGLLGDISRF